MRLKLTKTALLVTTAASTFCAIPAFAAESDESVADGSQTIIVTAQRKEEALQDVPISITALSSEALEKANIVNIRDVQNIAPSFKVSSTGVFMQLSIRGITSTALGPGVENNIALYVDGFYQPSSVGLGGDLANVSNVQILKGPQGTLYGRNATGGALLVSTREPSSDEMIADFSIGYGNLNDVRAKAYIGVPISEGLSFGVGGYYRQNDGYVKDITGFDAAPYENWEVRAKLKYEATSDLTFTLGYNHVWKDDGTAYAYGFQDNLILGAPPQFGFAVPPIGPLRTDKVGVSSVDTLPINSTNLDEVTFKAVWDTGMGTLSSYTSYADEDFHVDVDFDGTKLPLQHFDAFWFRETFQQSLDFQTNVGDTIDLTIGGMYYDDDSSQLSNFFFGSEAFVAAFGDAVLFQLADTRMQTKGIAGYVDMTWQAVESLYLNAGIRYSRDKRKINSEFLGGLAFPPGTPFPLERAPLTEASFASWTPRFTVRYEFMPDMNLYASYSKGFKSGTFNSTGQNAEALTTPVKPETVDAFELGVKGSTGRIYFDVAGYYYDYKNLQVNSIQTFNDGGVERTATLLTNAATAEIYGVEASFTAAISDQFNIRAAAAYTHARYKDFENSNPYVPGPMGFNVRIDQDLSGRRIARAPDWTFNIGADYTIPVGDGELVLAANGAYSSEYAPASEAYDPVTGENLYYQDGYFQANATMDYHLPGDQATIGVWVNNLTDEQYDIINEATGLGTRRIPSMPRTYGIKIGYKY